jgi:hypothetical protein
MCTVCSCLHQSEKLGVSAVPGVLLPAQWHLLTCYCLPGKQASKGHSGDLRRFSQWEPVSPPGDSGSSLCVRNLLCKWRCPVMLSPSRLWKLLSAQVRVPWSGQIKVLRENEKWLYSRSGRSHSFQEAPGFPLAIDAGPLLTGDIPGMLWAPALHGQTYKWTGSKKIALQMHLPWHLCDVKHLVYCIPGHIPDGSSQGLFLGALAVCPGALSLCASFISFSWPDCLDLRNPWAIKLWFNLIRNSLTSSS